LLIFAKSGEQTSRWNSRAPARQGPSPEERHPCTRYTPRCGRANAFQPSCLVRVRRASPWRKGKRKSGRPEAPMRPLCAGARRRASPVSFFQWGKTRKHQCASPLPDFRHGAALAQLWGTHTPASHVPPPSPLPPYRSPGSARTSSPRSPNRRSTALARHPCERLRPRNSVPSPALHSTRPSAAPTLLPCCPPPPRRALLGRGRARRALTRKTIETATSFSAIQFPATRTFSVGIYFR
jgi:hypothetical protein